MQKAVIFDLDGTLIHSLPDIKENLNIMLKHFGYPTVSEERVRGIIGNGARNLVKDAINFPISDAELDQRLNFYNHCYTNSDNNNTLLFNGIPELLTSLNNKGYILAICTNKPQETTDRLYNKLLKQFNFKAVFGQRAGVPVKPDRQSVAGVFSALNVLPENCYFIGDMEIDYLTAVNSGCKPINVLWGYGEKSKLLSLGANLFAENPKDILKII